MHILFSHPVTCGFKETIFYFEIILLINNFVIIQNNKNTMQLQPNYIIDNKNNKIAVQIDIETYEKITEALENFALYKLIEENKDEEKLSLNEAQEYYQNLKKSNGN